MITFVKYTKNGQKDIIKEISNHEKQNNESI